MNGLDDATIAEQAKYCVNIAKSKKKPNLFKSTLQCGEKIFVCYNKTIFIVLGKHFNRLYSQYHEKTGFKRLVYNFSVIYETIDWSVDENLMKEKVIQDKK